ncbi:MAG TPA: FdhF/YdeP family oxidoreductase [Anaeromyxobacter sp.]|nr:FdhF/YdeP family oxidoreductase [Anaeromyxobacter sp.]
MARIVRSWRPSIWASWKPFGLGEERPNAYAEILRAVRDNRGRLGYAWRILSRGCCDGCSLGTTGMRDWTMPGVHLCNVRLRLLQLNTARPFDPALLEDPSRLPSRTAAALRGLGRLPAPMLRRRGERGFRRIGWEEALDLVAGRVRQSTPGRLAFYLTSRGLANEAYFVAQKAVRALGTNSIDNAARVCHSPSTFGLKGTVGAAATTCSYSDWLQTDLIVFIGSNVANNQPVAMKYLHYARRAGTAVAVVNTYREPGMERYWVPSIVESALFGTRVTDRFFLVATGGDVPFLSGALKALLAAGMADEGFIREHTSGFPELAARLERQPWEELERLSGATRAEMEALGRMVGRARRAVFVWSMGITQHQFGEDNVRAIVNLGLSRGFVGREGCGLMPIRGHSGVQGGAEMGAYSTVLPGGAPIGPESAAQLSTLWGFPVPATRGLTAPEMIDAAHGGGLDLLFSVGGNFLEILPDPGYVREALERIPLRVHMDIVASPQMLVEPAEAVLLLPATTRYETRGGVTETSTERRVIFSPEIPGPRVAEARDEWAVFAELVRRCRPGLAEAFAYQGTADVRRDIARTIPSYQGIERLEKAGDQFQYGGPHLCAGWRFATPDGKAHFSQVPLHTHAHPPGTFVVSTRRGKQFNSMVQEEVDPLNGAARDAVLMSPEDASRLGLRDGEEVALENDQGRLMGRVRLAPMKPGNLQIHWPEAQVLLSPDAALRGVQSGIPDYNAVARVVPLQAPRARDPAARAGVDGEARPARPPGPEPLPPPRRPPEQPPVHP